RTWSTSTSRIDAWALNPVVDRWPARHTHSPRGGGRAGGRKDVVTPVLTSAVADGLDVFRRGKVRDTFQLHDGTLLMVATDRISAFDVVLPSTSPDDGRVLTQMSLWWFGETRNLVPNHLPPARQTP